MLSSLLPYIFTWNLGGGGEWRFTMHAYPVYLVSAMSAVWATARFCSTLWPQRGAAPLFDGAWRRRAAGRLSVAVVIAAGGLWWNHRAPAFVVAESLRAGEATSVSTGPRDGIFFREGWSELSTKGNVVSRFATTRGSVVFVPLPEPRRYRLVIRMDPLPPASGEPPQRVEVRLGSQRLADFELTLNPGRVGSYTVGLPAELAGRGLSRLTLVARYIRPAGGHALDYSSLTPDTPVAFRMWYLRLIPE
jgi:hypothetical protein